MKQLPLNFVSRALNGIDQLPPQERADHYDFAASVLAASHPSQAAAAARAAQDLREAESSQLIFKSLLRNQA